MNAKTMKQCVLGVGMLALALLPLLPTQSRADDDDDGDDDRVLYVLCRNKNVSFLRFLRSGSLDLDAFIDERRS